ncbi:MAG: M16 family metallopeptidase [Hyphomicrobiales bacterium]
MIKRFTGFIAGLALLLAWAAPGLALDIEVADFKLANGMEVVVIPDRRAPVVTHIIWYRVGSADEPQGKSGIAHFLEHLLFKGTAKYPAGEFSRLIRLNGGEDNAFTTRDYTGYFQRIAKDRLGLVMELEADRMQNLVLTDENVLPELQVVQEERRERTDNDPASLLGEQLDAVMYAAHPYGKPVIGWMSEVMQLTRQDAVDFYRAHYTPANAILVVAGDVTAEAVKALAEKHYGALKNGFDPLPRKRTMEPAPIAARRVIMKDARAASPTVQRNYLAPSYATATGNEAEALDVLAEILGGGTQSRLYRKLVVERKLAAFAGAWYAGDALDYASFGVYGAPNPGVDLDKVEQAIDEAIADAVKNGVTQEELDRAKARLLADTIYALDNQATLARIFGMALATGLTVADVLGWESKVEKLTVADIHKAAGVLRIEASVTGRLIPEPPQSQN